MSEPATRPDPAERLEDLPRILQAMREAVTEALRRHKQAGYPVAVWRANQVVWVSPEDIPLPEDEPRPRRE